MNKIASNIIKSLLVASVFSISGSDVEDTNDYMYTLDSDNNEQMAANRKHGMTVDGVCTRDVLSKIL